MKRASYSRLSGSGSELVRATAKATKLLLWSLPHLLAFPSLALAHGGEVLIILGALYIIPLTLVSLFVDYRFLKTFPELDKNMAQTANWQINLTTFISGFFVYPLGLYLAGILIDIVFEEMTKAAPLPSWITWGCVFLVIVFCMTLIKSTALRLFFNLPFKTKNVGLLAMANILNVILSYLILRLVNPFNIF